MLNSTRFWHHWRKVMHKFIYFFQTHSSSTCRKQHVYTWSLDLNGGSMISSQAKACFVKHGLYNLVLMKCFVKHGLINYVLMKCELSYYRSRHLGSRMPFDNDCGKHFFHPSFKRGRTTLWPYRNFLLDWWDTAHHIHSNNGLHDCNYHIGEMSVYHCPIEGLYFMHLDHCFTGKRINSLQIYH